MTSESFETLWEYCSQNKRAIPKDWMKFYDQIEGTRQLPSGGWDPPLPLILSAWYHTIPLEKNLRFMEQLKWAVEHCQINRISNYLHSLSEDEWFHFGEI